MKNNLLFFIEIYCVLIVILFISVIEEVFDQSNEFLINLLVGWFCDFGFNVEVQLVLDMCYKFNLLVSIGYGVGGLLFVGYIDIVLFDDGCWMCDLFIFIEYDNKFYGFGMVDMKGFFVFIFDVLCDVDVIMLKKLLYILVIVDEEISMVGVCYFVEIIQLCLDCVIIGEFIFLQLICVYKGYMFNVICIQGQFGYFSDLVCGVNVIELMYDVIGWIMQLCDLFKECYYFEVFMVFYLIFNLGVIYGGDVLNCICVCCELYMDICLLLGMILNDFNGLLGEVLVLVSECWLGCLMFFELYLLIFGYECLLDYKLVQVVEKLFGVQIDVVNYCIEVLFIQMLCLMLVFGLGFINQVYQFDEFLEMCFIKLMWELISQVVYYFCWY